MTSQHPERSILSVSQLNHSAKTALEAALPEVWVEGELSNFARPSSGHWYFTLKDSRAQVRCAMFRGRNFAVRFKPENGIKVVVKANVSLYEGRGDYQLIVDHIEQAGAGDLQQQFERIKAKLFAEGLMDEQRKRELPAWPQKIAVVTSPSGAAIQDILNVLRRRYPILEVIVCATPVQGREAAAQIVNALERANRHTGADLIILARGGGSLEDLWCFDDEHVARAIAASSLPVVSAVGHEIDFTISDFVADCRAPTPSAAAELVSPDRAELIETFNVLEQRLSRAAQHKLNFLAHSLRALSKRLRHPQEIILQHSQTLDQLEIRLKRALKQYLKSRLDALNVLQLRLKNQSPQRQLREKTRLVELSRQRLNAAIGQQIQNQQQRLEKCAARLHALSPLQTLQRGYAIVKKADGAVVQTSEQVQLGEALSVQLHQGQLEVKVNSTNKP